MHLRPLSFVVVACLLLAPACSAGDGSAVDPADVEGDAAVVDARFEADSGLADETVDAEALGDAVDWTGGGPLGNVYLSSPVADDGQTTPVALRHLQGDDGTLTGAFVQVFNCRRDDDAEFNALSGMKVCTPAQTALAGADGSWRHVLPPADASSVDDPFAEVQMYFHVTRVHDYFAATHGVTGLAAAMPAIVNFGADYGQGFEVYDNAAFMPDATVGIFGFELDTRGGAIVFGQGEAVDYAYDASVIYHEYTHALTGEDRLFGYTADEQGFNPQPFSMNEAFADYFAATLLDDPVLGRYALVQADRDASRDLSELRTCPEHMLGEVHYDGRMWASALWALRQQVGPLEADAIVLATLLACGARTTFTEASELLLAEAARRGPGAETAAREALELRGLLDCRRVKPWRDLDEVPEGEWIDLPGRLSSGHDALNQLTTMAYQFVVEVPAGATSARLDFTAEAGMGWQGPLNLRLAVRRGQQVLYDYPSGKLTPVADAVLTPTPPAAEGAPWQVELEGPWLQPGPLYLHFLNRMIADVEFTSMRLVFQP